MKKLINYFNDKKIFVKACSMVVVFVMVLAMAVSPCSAADSLLGDYTFNEVIELSGSLAGVHNINFSCNGIDYGAMEITYMGYWVFLYGGYDVSSSSIIDPITVYSSSTGWTDASYMNIIIQNYNALSSDFIDWLVNSKFVSSDGFYYDIYNIFKPSLFGESELTSIQDLSLSISSTIISLLLILVPFLVVGAIFIWIMKRL